MKRIRLGNAVPSLLSALAALLQAAGARPLAGGDWELDCGDGEETVLIAVITSDGRDVSLTEAVELAIAAGQRVIGLWLQGAAPSALPAVLADFGGAAVAWSPDALRDAICDEEPVWQESGGGERMPPGTRRNVCR